MAQTYLMHTNGSIGIADIPDWLDFNEQPPRSFEITFIDKNGGGIFKSITTTQHTTPITKEVADILRSNK